MTENKKHTTILGYELPDRDEVFTTDYQDKHTFIDSNASGGGSNRRTVSGDTQFIFTDPFADLKKSGQ